MTYSNALVYDLRLSAWHKMKFSDSAASGALSDVFVTKDSAGCGKFSNVKFLAYDPETLWVMDVCRGTRVTDIYKDWTGEEVPAYLVLGPDNLGNWQNRRQAPVVHVFSFRTTLNPDQNDSSIKMSCMWDWTDNPVAGKWGTQQEVHRMLRPFVPETLTGPLNDGYPVVVTRNKVRGRGRALQLKFESSSDKDAHILGYAIRYHITGRL